MDLNFSWDWFQPFCCNSEYFNTLINGISTKVFNIHNHFLSSEVQNRIEINFVEFSTKDGFEAEFDEFVYCILHNVDLKAFADVSTAGLKHKFIRWFILPNAITFPVSSFNLLSFVVFNGRNETKSNDSLCDKFPSQSLWKFSHYTKFDAFTRFYLILIWISISVYSSMIQAWLTRKCCGHEAQSDGMRKIDSSQLISIT